MNRRSFFQSLARAAATVALAPQLAFRVKPLPIKAPEPQQIMVSYWMETSRHSMCYDNAYLEAMGKLVAERKVGELYVLDDDGFAKVSAMFNVAPLAEVKLSVPPV